MFIKVFQEDNGKLKFMKRIFLLISLHLISLVPTYMALGITLAWISNIMLPFGGFLTNNPYFIASTYIIYPFIAFLCIKLARNMAIHKVLGYIYILLWLMAVFRLIYVLFSK